MDPITLITTAVSLAAPYLLKTGESIAEGIGEDLWKIIKKPFKKKYGSEFSIDVNNQEEKDKLINDLLEEIKRDNNFHQELEIAVEKSQKELQTCYQQNINNNGNINKQLNVHNNSGDINF